MNFEDLFVSTITEKRVFYFSSDKITSLEPHFFVCLKKTDEEVIILVCCTSQYDTMNKLITTRKLSNSTIVWIKPNPGENPFSEDTYINCNWACTYTVDEFKKMFDNKKIQPRGEISENDYHQILTGVHQSVLVEEDIKEKLPRPEDI